MSKKGKTPPAKKDPPKAPPKKESKSKRQGGHPDYSVTKSGKSKKSGGYGGMSSSSYADLGLLDHFGDKVYIRAKLKKRSKRS
tara:strand:+ start:1173 stop:1421 length:249 start_codon:yes stop_codon:yes gene_type:complete